MKDINLMPEETKPNFIPKQREVSNENNVSAKAILILVGVLIIAAASLLSPKIYVKSLETQASAIQAEIDSEKYIKVKSVNQQISAMQATLDLKKDVINSISNEDVQILDVINYLEESAPVGLFISEMKFDDKNLIVKGLAKDSTAIAEYMSNIARLSVFKGYTSNATFKYDQANVELIYELQFTQIKQGE